VQFDLCFDFGSDDWKREYVCKVFGKSDWIHTLNLATSKFGKLTQRLDVALSAFY